MRKRRTRWALFVMVVAGCAPSAPAPPPPGGYNYEQVNYKPRYQGPAARFAVPEFRGSTIIGLDQDPGPVYVRDMTAFDGAIAPVFVAGDVPVLVKLVTLSSDGKPLIQQSGTDSTKLAGREHRYHVELRAPNKPGTYHVEVEFLSTSAGKMMLLGEWDVEVQAR